MTMKRLPTRLVLYNTQVGLSNSISDTDTDEYHFYATHSSTPDSKRALAKLNKEIKRVEIATAKYLTVLKIVRDRINDKVNN
jgi:hypothetical protein